MTPESLFVVTVLVTASFVRGALGFGEALVAMPLLALALPTKEAAPLVALASVLVAAVILLREWRHVVLRSATLLTFSGLLGVPVGVYLLRFGDDRIVKGLLAAVVLGFSLWCLWKPTRHVLNSDRLAPVFGGCAGVLGGAYNTAGPPLVIFGTLRGWSPPQFRATLQTYCILASIWVIAVQSFNGLVTQQTLLHFGMAAVPVVGATLLGRFAASALSPERFVRFVYVALVAVGIGLLVSCLSTPEAVSTAAS